jgi:hypothetical protein
MEKIDWFYVYSPRYYPFHLYLQDKIPKNTFNAKGIFVDQSVFDEHLYKHEGEHFFSRITVKVEAVLNLIRIKRAAGDTRPFYFTDCDILVGDLVDDLKIYTKSPLVDIWFQREYKNSATVNPGVMLIRPSEKTEDFWSRVLEDMKVTEGTADLQSTNKILQQTNLIWNLFAPSSACSSITREAIPFSIYHILCGCDSRELDIGNKMCEASNCGQPMDKYVDQTRAELGRLYF